MAYYLVSYATDKPKGGHKPAISTQLVEAEGRSTAMKIFLAETPHPELWQVQVDWAGSKILREMK